VTPPIRVLIVEDQAIVREGLVSLLASRPDLLVVGEAADGVEAVNQHRALTPDVTLLDLRMPKLAGAAVVRAIRREAPRARFVVLTTYSTDEEVYEALAAGAQAYLLKGVRAAELVDTIRAVHAGHRYIPPEIAARAVGRSLASPLTPRERELLTLAAAGRSNAEIGAKLGITERTVKNHLHAVFAKLGVTSRTQAILVAVQRGLVQID
jgi:DNA-binding NarL/FixJ family response regulator